MRWPFTSIKNASGSPQIQSAARCGARLRLRTRLIKWHFAEQPIVCRG